MIFLFRNELKIPIEKIIITLKIKTIKNFWSREGKSPSIICFIVIFWSLNSLIPFPVATNGKSESKTLKNNAPKNVFHFNFVRPTP